jgi:hypothetical protein
LIATALVWIVALAFPRTSSRIFSLVADQQLPRYGTLLTVLAMAIPFAPPFVAAFALGRLLWPAREPTKGVMASFDYAQKANQRWLIVVGAGIVGGLNCFLLLVALLNATGN